MGLLFPPYFLARQLPNRTIRRFSGALGVLRRRSAPLPCLINIGAGKAGTSTLYALLRQHPEINATLSPWHKELDFFSLNYFLGESWYRAVLDTGADHSDPPRRTIDVSPSYFWYPEAPSRIARHLPDAKLLVLLRDPVERAVSAYQFYVSRGSRLPSPERLLGDEMDLLAPMLDRPWPEIVDRVRRTRDVYLVCAPGLYRTVLDHWFRSFSRDQFFLVKSEDFFANQQRTMDRICRFAGLAPFRLPNEEYVNRGRYPVADHGLRTRLRAFYGAANRGLTDLIGAEFSWD